MKINTILVTFISAFMVFTILGSNAQAYQFYSDNTNDQGGCAQCHTGFRDNHNYFSHAEGVSWGDSLHNIHLGNTDVETSCDNCHGGAGTSGRTVNTSSSDKAKDGVNAISCSGCHGRLEDANTVTVNGTGWGAGLRQHHETSTNPIAGAGTCSGCHADADPANFTPASEDTMPPWYASVVNTTLSNIPMAPCSMNGEENFSLNGAGLDNDGDHLYDTLDPDCIVAPDSDGDLNDDGVVNTVDVLLAQRMLMGQIPANLARGDVAPLAGGVPAPNGLFDLGDVLLIQRKALGQITF
jgi:hypothetical protein